MTLPSKTNLSERPQLNDEQSLAVTAIIDWLENSKEMFFVLRGRAGTGKTFCIQQLPARCKGNFIFTAPTNKATRVLRQSVTTSDYRPACRTIYSLLGLKLESSGEVRELTAPDDPVDLSRFKCIIVDEGSMISENLRTHIHKAADEFGVKFLFMGDPAQLPPVGEPRSPIWRIKVGYELTKIMRFDNEILALTSSLADVVDHMAPKISLLANNSNGEGVFRYAPPEWRHAIANLSMTGEFSKPAGAKIIAWRNVTVDTYNKSVRSHLFQESASFPWLATDRVLFMAPAKDLEDEQIASTDDEGVVTKVMEDWHPAEPSFKIYRINILLDDGARPVQAFVLHPDSQRDYQHELQRLTDAATANRRAWKAFWEFKELFHQLRHAYAITAHRSQGSTYETAFVDWRDILLNRNRSEAARCLYVACSRPKKTLIFQN